MAGHTSKAVFVLRPGKNDERQRPLSDRLPAHHALTQQRLALGGHAARELLHVCGRGQGEARQADVKRPGRNAGTTAHLPHCPTGTSIHSRFRIACSHSDKEQHSQATKCACRSSSCRSLSPAARSAACACRSCSRLTSALLQDGGAGGTIICGLSVCEGICGKPSHSGSRCHYRQSVAIQSQHRQIDNRSAQSVQAGFLQPCQRQLTLVARSRSWLPSSVLLVRSSGCKGGAACRRCRRSPPLEACWRSERAAPRIALHVCDVQNLFPAAEGRRLHRSAAQRALGTLVARSPGLLVIKLSVCSRRWRGQGRVRTPPSPGWGDAGGAAQQADNKRAAPCGPSFAAARHELRLCCYRIRDKHVLPNVQQNVIFDSPPASHRRCRCR